MPTRNRAATAARAMTSFVDAVRAAAPGATLRLVVSDDSDAAIESESLLTVVADIKSLDPAIAVDIVARPADRAIERSILSPGTGPGAARNRALEHLRNGPDDHDVLIMFDDDMCFTDVDYRGRRLRSEGPAVIREALGMCDLPTAVVGCEYVGRQDLSILEHIRLDKTGVSSMIAPALARANIASMAPGGISTAFLAVAAPAWRLPDFPEHYNEDYVWLNALELAGWPLLRTTSQLAHVPPGEVAVDSVALSYQVFGEIVWLAVLERKRYPLDQADSLARAVNEIVEDLRAAHREPRVVTTPTVYSVVSLVLHQYEALRADLTHENDSLTTSMIRRAILNGLNIKPLGLDSANPVCRRR